MFDMFDMDGWVGCLGLMIMIRWLTLGARFRLVRLVRLVL